MGGSESQPAEPDPEPFRCSSCGHEDWNSNTCIPCRDRADNLEAQRRAHELQEQQLAATREKEKQQYELQLKRMTEEAEKARREHEERIRKQEEESKARLAKIEAEKEKAKQLQAQEHERKMAQQEAKREKEKAEAKKESDKQKQEHERKMAEEAAQREKERQIEIEKQRKERLQELINRTNEAISKFDIEIEKLDKKILGDTAKMKELYTEQEKNKKDLKEVENEMKEFADELSNKIDTKEKKLDIHKIRQSLDACNKRINGAIDKTCVSESNIGRFLHLTQYLNAATLNNQAEIDKLSQQINTFATLIKREGSGKIAVEDFFTIKDMVRLIPIFENEDMNDLEDLVCDKDDYPELLEIVANGLEEEHEKWLSLTEDEKKEQDKTKEPKKKLTFKEKNLLKKVCLKADETWKKDAQGKARVLQKRLNVTAPVYCLFYERIHDAMKQIQLILDYGQGDGLNDQQREAIKALPQEEEKEKEKGKPKAITMNTSTKKEEIISKEMKETEIENDNKEEESSSTVSKIACIGKSVDDNKISEDSIDEEELLSSLNKLSNPRVKDRLEESLALRRAAVCSIHVVESISDKLDACGEAGGTAYGLVKGVESTCMNIARAQADIRGSIVLSQEICRLKPAVLTDEAKLLWDAVDNGIIQIYNSALKLNKSSQEYFGYFFRFRQSFSYYLTAKDESINVSTEYLQRDMRDFQQYSKKFEKEVALLSKSAMECIKSCVKNSFGAEEFEKARSDREALTEQYLNARNELSVFKHNLNEQYKDLFTNKVECQAKIETTRLIIESLKNQIEADQEMKKQTSDARVKLNQAKAQLSYN